ncbi:hybrid sensor histidine kinase/response regulator transcription factor [Flammeovirga pacifica]|uniref:histidine kinase n=1 Tax=Flammeovirga pacifica TaxID=915059 RepID=A0A1S1YUP0_FLAPC|nr:ATP-binding protein [Flammeovirga pacifica]OHX64747.1 hypothetical protein NH26_24605 [Flammeovirga pacifica]
MCFFVPQLSWAQTAIFDNINIADGLSDNFVISMDIDSTGNIWLGTRNGVNKFDGYQFEHFKPHLNKENTLLGNTVTAINTDQKGDVWLLTNNGGINHYSPKENKFNIHTTPELIQNLDIRSGEIFTTSDSIVWIRNTWSVRTFDLKTNKVCIFPIKENYKLLQTQKNKIILCGAFGIMELKYSNDQIESKSLYSKKSIYSIVEFDDHFIGLDETNILEFDHHFKRIKTLGAINKYVIEPVEITAFVISDTDAWIGTLYNLNHYKKENGKYVYKGSYLDKNSISKVQFDKEGNLWASTVQSGLFLYNKNKNNFKHHLLGHPSFGKSNILQANNVSAICKTKDQLWIGTFGNGIFIKDKNNKYQQIRHYVDKWGLQQDLMEVRDIYQDSKNNIWVGTANFLAKFDPKTKKVKTLQHFYEWDWPYATYTIKEVNQGTLILTGSDKIALLDLESYRLKFLPQHINGIYLWSVFRDISIDDEGNLWFIQNNRGLLKVDKNLNKYSLFDRENSGFSDDRIASFFIDGDSIFLATNSGLDIFSIKKSKIVGHFDEEDGLSNNVVNAIQKDKDNNLWLCTGKGINCLSLATGKITKHLTNTLFLTDAYHFDDDGSMYFGSYDKVIEFNPDQIQIEENIAQPTIASLYLFNEQIFANKLVHDRILLDSNYLNQEEIKFNYDENSLSFSFNAYPFNYPRNDIYRYKLEGLHDDWFYTDVNHPIAHYASILPGEYTFLVQIQYQDGNWSPSAELPITIAPPYWQTTWFTLLIICGIVIISAFIVQLRLASLREQKAKLSALVDEQTKELLQQNQQIKDISEKLHQSDQAKLQFFTNISHEFRTPLTLIQGYLDTINKRGLEESKAVIQRNVHRLLDMVDQLINIRKLDNGQMKLHVKSVSLNSFIEQSILPFQVLAKQKNININFQAAKEVQYVWIDKDKLEKILFNLISNAIKYTPKDGSIYIRTKTSSERVYIAIEDNGIGMTEEDKKLIFDRFYRNNVNTAEGHGIGLSFVKGLVNLLKGEIDVQSDEGQGSTFTVSFLLGKEHFNVDDFSDTTHSSNLQPLIADKVIKKVDKNFGYKILLVEDNIELMNYLIDLLQSNYELKTATNGREALDILEDDFTPDVIISDIMMPIMDGVTFTTTIKDNIKTSHIPVILLSAKNDIETKIKGFELGIDDYIVKPFDSTLFLSRVIALIQNRERFKEAILSFNPQEEIVQQSLNKKDKEFWDQINNVIEEHYSEYEFNAEKLANYMLMSRSAFYKKFKELTGLNAAEHIKKVRLHKAEEMVRAGETNLEKLSMSVGYKSPSRLKTNYISHFGVSPISTKKKD